MSAGPDFIYRFIPSTDRAAPLLLLLHGTGGNENDLLELGAALSPGAPLLSPRGKILENGMPRFFQRLAEGVFDEEDLVSRTHELADFLEARCAQEDLSGRPVFAVGYSNGANIAASLLLLRPKVLSGAILFRAMVPLQPEKPPELTGKPVLLLSGRSDPLIPTENVERLAAILEGAGARVELQWTPAGHALTSPEIAAAQEWLTGRY